MLRYFASLFQNKKKGELDSLSSMPWDEGPSILEHVRSHIDPATRGLTDGGETLPDQDRINKGSEIRWTSGALEGVAIHHLNTDASDKQVKKTVNLVLAFCSHPSAKNRAALYRHILDENVDTVSIIDPVLEALIHQEQINYTRLHELAHSFVTTAPDREPVKFGIAILGLFHHPENEELFHTLGRHEEFTLYCVVALANATQEPDRALWRLGRQVDGWGRIHVVERLSQTEDSEIKDWLLREGYRNSVMNEYLAYTCATTGNLLAALSQDRVDRGLLTSAGEIIQALITGGPAEDIEGYEDGLPVIQRYLSHMDNSAETISDFLHVHTIKRYLDDEDADWKSRSQRGWTDEHRAELINSCHAVLERTHWPKLVKQALLSQEEFQFLEADSAAAILGIDTWEHHWPRLLEKPTDSGRWYRVMKLVDEQRLPHVLEVAEQAIDLSKIATGPADALGVGPGYELHLCLGFILQDLTRFPGHGAAFIEAGLKSPVVSNRNMALNALSRWEQEQWPRSTLEVLQSSMKEEPNDDVRSRMAKAHNGEVFRE